MLAGKGDVERAEVTVAYSPRRSSVGKLWLVACLVGIEALGMRLLTKHMGWDADEARETLQRVTGEFRDLAMDPGTGEDFGVNLMVLTARKPLPGEREMVVTENNGAGVTAEAARGS